MPHSARTAGKQIRIGSVSAQVLLAMSPAPSAPFAAAVVSTKLCMNVIFRGWMQSAIILRHTHLKIEFAGAVTVYNATQ
jgi:hypothetical protein